MFRRIVTALLFALGLALPLPAFSGASLPPGMLPDASNALPQSARGNLGLGGWGRGHIRVWQPFLVSTAVNVDTTSQFDSRTTFITAAVAEDDFVAARVVLQNAGTASWSIADAAISGSSRLGASGFTGVAAGVTAYDGNSAALTSWNYLTWGNNGIAAPPTLHGQPTAPANATSHVTQNQVNGAATSMTLESISGVQIGQPLIILSPTNGLYPWTTVASISGTTITLSQGAYTTIPSGTTVYFPALGITVPAATNPPLPNLVYSDWVPVASYARTDGPLTHCLAAGSCTALDTAGAIPAATTATQNADGITVTLSQGLSAPMPAGTKVRFCQAQATNATLTPNFAMSFASAAGVVAGMTATIGETTPKVSGETGDDQVTSVASVSGGTVTFNDPLSVNQFAPNNWGSGTSVAFSTVVTPSSAVSSGTSIPIAAGAVPLASLAGTTFTVMSSNIDNALAGNVTGTVSGSTLTLSQAVQGTINSGQPITLYFLLSTNAAATPVVSASFATNPPNVLPGFTIEGPGFPANDYVSRVAPGPALGFNLSPTATVAGGTSLNLCSPPIATTQAAAQGATTLTFQSTYHKRRLISVRLNITGHASYWSNSGQTNGQWGGIGGGFFIGGTCSTGLDGVATPNAINDGANGCAGSTHEPVLAIEVLSLRHGATIAVVGDSHMGSTTIASANSFGAQLVRALSTPSLPVSFLNLAWGGSISPVTIPYAEKRIADLQPDIVFIPAYERNDGQSATSQQSYFLKAMALASQVRAYGGTAVLTTDYPRAVYGCNGEDSREALREANIALLKTLAGNDLPVLDLSAVMTDTAHTAPNAASGQGFSLARYQGQNCVHANDAGHAAMAAAAQALIAPYLGH